MNVQELPAPIETAAGWKPDPADPGKVRWWAGAEWTDRVGQEVTQAATTDGQALTRKTTDQRRAILAQRLQYVVNAEGGRIESQTDYQAVVVTGHRTNHLLHLILTILTLGLWAIVWVVLALAGGEKRRIITVDEYGQTLG